jgi:DNA-directed RNA polymerase alpha subunit
VTNNGKEETMEKQEVKMEVVIRFTDTGHGIKGTVTDDEAIGPKPIDGIFLIAKNKSMVSSSILAGEGTDMADIIYSYWVTAQKEYPYEASILEKAARLIVDAAQVLELPKDEEEQESTH